MLAEYYRLTKPGIIRGNLLMVTAGFLLGSRGDIAWSSFIGVLLGSTLVIAGGCVINNYIDRAIDKKMTRTKKRATVTGAISGRSTLIFGAVLTIIGFAVLLTMTNLMTTAVGFVGFVFYVVFYSIYKRRSPVGTLVGSVSGATPPVAGYVAATNTFDLTAVLLFFILVFWQMAHFYAIAIYRKSEYEKAGLPLLSIERGVTVTHNRIIGYMVAFFITIISLFVSSGLGYVYLVVMLGVVVFWFRYGLAKFNEKNANAWAQGVFGSSLFVLLAFSVAVSLASFIS